MAEDNIIRCKRFTENIVDHSDLHSSDPGCEFARVWTEHKSRSDNQMDLYSWKVGIQFPYTLFKLTAGLSTILLNQPRSQGFSPQETASPQRRKALGMRSTFSVKKDG